MSRLPKISANGRGRRIAAIAAFACAQAGAAGVAAFATRDVFAALRAEAPTDAGQPIAVIALSGLAIAGLRIAERRVAERVGQDYAAALREKLFVHISRMPARAVAGRRAGGLTLRFVGDLSAVRGWVSLGLGRLISSSIALPGAAIVLLGLNPQLGAAAIAPIVLGIGAMAVVGWRLAPVHRRLRARRARLAADMSERTPHAPELRLMGRIDIERENLHRRTKKLIDAAMQRATGAGTLEAIPDAAAGIAAAALFATAFRTGAAPADVAGAMAALSVVVHPMRRLAGVWDRHRAWTAARKKCEQLLTEPRLKRARQSASQDKAPCDRTPARVVFEEVAGGALHGLTADVAPGARIALVGPNGAGKSTLLALAAGLEQPRSGKALIDNRPPTAMTAAERRRAVAFAGARSPLLAGSLRRALTMGCAARPTDAEILSVAERFGLASAVERLGGLNGHIAEGGRNLSSGETRRMRLTRAALAKPRLLLLDEPDDALDPAGADLVATLLDMTDATALIATHNPRVARAADEIWLIEKGALVETGAANERLDADGRIAAFFRLRPAA